MIEEGLVITLIGMTVVFIFLSIMVIAIKITSWLVLKFSGNRREIVDVGKQFPSVKSDVKTGSGPSHDDELELIAASVAAAKFLSEQEIE